MNVKVLLSILVLFSLLASCNMPAGQVPVTQSPGDERVSLDTNAMATAVELTAAARLTEIAGSVPAALTPTPNPTFTAMPTQCSPTVTSTVNANVRSGPGTAYDIVGSLMLGQSAIIVGRNDAYTWWYINYPSAGSYAWIAGSVVTAACVPSVVQVVAAPPLPTAVATDSSSASDSGDGEESGGSSSLPDLVPAGMQVARRSGSGAGHHVSVQVRVRNRGQAAAGSFTVEWRPVLSAVGCSWTVDSLGPGASKSLSCNYTYLKSCVGGACNIVLVVDPLNQVAESNEDNNNQQGSYDQTP